jgi:Fe-S-cluster containining protein
MHASGAGEELAAAVESARGRVDACAAVRAIYARLQVEIDRRKPICVASGKCCHFESYGHRLYVTTLELATFVNDLNAGSEVLRRAGSIGEESGSSEYLRTGLDTGGCPLQKGKLCGVHAIRPFGCRIFFCDPTAGQWQQQQYELFHAELKQLHDRFEIPYFYVEWRFALDACLGRRLTAG